MHFIRKIALPIPQIKVCLTLLEAKKIREILEQDRDEINYRGKYGDTLLHSLMRDFLTKDAEELQKAKETLAVLLEFGIRFKKTT